MAISAQFQAEIFQLTVDSRLSYRLWWVQRSALQHLTILAVTLLAFDVTHISSSSSNSLFWADLHFPLSAHTGASDLTCGWHCALQKILFTYFTYLYQKFCLQNVTVKSVTAYIPVYMLHVATYTIVNKDFIYCIFLSHHLPVNAYLSCSGERRLGWPSSPH